MENEILDEEIKHNNDILQLRNLIAKKLSESPKTEEELKGIIPNASYAQISEALRALLFLKLVKKEGFPAKYVLSEEVAKKLEERREISSKDKNIIKVNIIIESKSNNKKSLREGMEKLLESIKKDIDYVIYNIDIADIVLDGDLFSTYISGELSCKNLTSLFKLIYIYGATGVDIIKPDKLNIHISDLQEALAIMTDMVHGYVQMVYEQKARIEGLEKALGRS